MQSLMNGQKAKIQRGNLEHNDERVQRKEAKMCILHNYHYHNFQQKKITISGFSSIVQLLVIQISIKIFTVASLIFYLTLISLYSAVDAFYVQT